MESVRTGEKVGDLWMKGFMEKMSFAPGVEQRTNNGWRQWWWRKWRTNVFEIRLHDQ